MARIAFTDVSVRNLPSPERGQRCFWDDSLPGFGVRISQGGSKTWIVLDPRAKVRVQETIGRYPVISLRDARGEAKRRLAENTLGKHQPRSARWDLALEQYLRELATRRKPSTQAEYKRLLEKYFRFGTTKLGEIAPNDLHKKLDAIDAPSERRHAYVVLRAFINWCDGKNYFAENPVKQVKVVDPSNPGSRVLSDEELAKVWNACGDDTYGRIVKLLLLTGQRRGEIANLTRAMFGTNIVIFPGWLTKNHREHAVPWIGETSELLQRGDSNPEEPILGVIGHRSNSKKPFSAWSKNKKALDARCGVKNWTLHDLRRTFRTGLGKLGVRPDIAERLVNHINARSDMEEVYDRWTYMPEMTEAMATWLAHVRSAVVQKRPSGSLNDERSSGCSLEA